MRRSFAAVALGSPRSSPPKIHVNRGILSGENPLSLTKKVCLCEVNDLVTSTVQNGTHGIQIKADGLI